MSGHRTGLSTVQTAPALLDGHTAVRGPVALRRPRRTLAPETAHRPGGARAEPLAEAGRHASDRDPRLVLPGRLDATRGTGRTRRGRLPHEEGRT
ncbi:hypothetical protein GCM10010266_44140 [Streptomyces griseomycini]|nr:hypothetical protein GCM10010266_44140 [Streptomyces griseomycini]